MANYNVRIFGYAGLRQMPLLNPRQMSTDSVVQLVQPYVFSQVLSIAPGGGAISSAPDATTQTQLLRIEVPDGQTIRYEINPPGRAVAASNASPSLSGKDQFEFHPGWSISIADIGAYP